MNKNIDPESLGLSSRTTVEVMDPDTWAIVINRKSRIIMADGRKIIDSATKIKKTKPDKKVILKTTAPVCSKTLQFLADQGIEVIRN